MLNILYKPKSSGSCELEGPCKHSSKSGLKSCMISSLEIAHALELDNLSSTLMWHSPLSLFVPLYPYLNLGVLKHGITYTVTAEIDAPVWHAITTKSSTSIASISAVTVVPCYWP
jgi:hypothetical protein